MVSPATVHGEDAHEPVKLPGDEVAVYPLMAEPPFEAGAVKDTTDWELAYDVAVTAVGAPAVVAGMAAADAAEAGPVPVVLVAVTVKV